MSWEYDRYTATCLGCGHIGVVIVGSDDWGRFSTDYEGFDTTPPSPTAVGRKRADARQSVARCRCGGSSIERGARLA